MLRTKKAISLLLIMALVIIMLPACTSPSYSKKHKKEITETYSAKAKLWFAENMPDAKVKSFEAVSDDDNLFCAIKGQYKLNRKTYTYCYLYDEDKMYLSQYEEDFSKLVNNELASLLNLNENEFSFELIDNGLRCKTTNDQVKDEKPNPEYEKILAEGMLPFKCSLSDEMRDAVYIDKGNSLYNLSLDIYTKLLPADTKEYLNRAAGISSIDYYLPSSWDQNGITKVTKTKDSEINYYMHIEKFEDNLYIGYTYSDDDLPDGSEISFNRLSNNEVSVRIPKGSRFIMFAKKDKYYEVKTSDKGKITKVKLYEWEKEKKFDGFKDYDSYSNRYFLPKSSLRCYCSLSNATSDAIIILQK